MRNPGYGLRPARGHRLQVPDQIPEPVSVVVDKASIPSLVLDDDMHHRQRQSGIRARPDQNHLICKRRGLGPAHIHHHDAGTAPLGDLDMAQRRGLTDGIDPPQDHQIGILAQIFLGRCLDRAGKPHTKTAQTPANHRGIPDLTPVKSGKPVHLGTFQPKGVIIGPIAVALPKPDRLSANRLHLPCNLVQRIAPWHHLPVVTAPLGAHQRGQQPFLVANNLMGGFPAHT